MRTLFAAACVVSLLGCGGPDESLDPSLASQGQAVQSSGETKLITEPMEQLPSPELAWQVVWERIGLDARLRLQAQSQEERVFYPVDVGAMTPETPAPPCPNCR